MKKNVLTLAVLFSIGTINAQTIDVKEGSDKFSTGTQNSLSTTILENSKDDVESEWKSLLKDFKNEKVKSDKGELFADNVIIKEWGNNTVDIYTTFEEDKKTKTVKMHVCFDLGGAYLKSSEQRDKYNYAVKMIHDFAVKMTKIPLESKVKDADKLLGKYQDDQKDLEKDNKNLKSDIESYKEKIKKAEDEVKKNEADQVTKKAAIEAQKKAVDAAKKLVENVK
jgi:hypothetical protein